jgi:hypothetical protein
VDWRQALEAVLANDLKTTIHTTGASIIIETSSYCQDFREYRIQINDMRLFCRRDFVLSARRSTMPIRIAHGLHWRFSM